MIAKWMTAGDIDGWLFKPFKIKDLSAMLESIGLPTAGSKRF
jgi:hypothetical protein